MAGYGSYKLSEFIKNLQDKLDRYGDGDIYYLGECAEHICPDVEVDIKTDSDYVWNEKKQDLEEVIKSKTVKYRLF